MELSEAIERLIKEKEITIEAIECSLSGTSERNDWGGLVQAINTVLAELDKQKQVKAEMRKVAWEEGYNQGYLAGIRAVTLDEVGLDDEEE